jgi:hypothetical protein
MQNRDQKWDALPSYREENISAFSAQRHCVIVQVDFEASFQGRTIGESVRILCLEQALLGYVSFYLHLFFKGFYIFSATDTELWLHKETKVFCSFPEGPVHHPRGMMDSTSTPVILSFASFRGTKAVWLKLFSATPNSELNFGQVQAAWMVSGGSIFAGRVRHV